MSKVNRKIVWLKKRFPNMDDKLKALSADLQRLGVTKDNTYLFIQGHHLKEQVTLRLLVPICSRLRREREAEIKALALHEQQFQNELTSYRHSGETVENILRKNVNCEMAPTYAMIEKDIQKLLDICRKSDPNAACTTNANSTTDAINTTPPTPEA